jgi:hypothetical protein
MRIPDSLVSFTDSTAKLPIRYFTYDGVVADGQVWMVALSMGNITKQRVIIRDPGDGEQRVFEFSGDFSMLRGNDVSVLYVGNGKQGNVIAIINRSSGSFYRYHNFQQYYREFFYNIPSVGFFESGKKYDVARDKACVAFEEHTKAVCQSLFRR